MSARPPILLIDDEELWRSGITKSLAAFGYDVDAVAELEEAREALLTLRYPVILVDRHFGEDTERGLEIIRELKTSDPSQEVILLTNYRDADAVEEARRYDAYATVEKGDLPTLVRYIDEVLLKGPLQLSRLQRPIVQAFLGNPDLEGYRAGLSRLKEPLRPFLESVFLAAVLAKLGLLSTENVCVVTDGTKLADELRDLPDLDQSALEHLAELASHLWKATAPHTLRTLVEDADCCLYANADSFLSLLVKINYGKRNAKLHDGHRIDFLRELVEADKGLFRIVPEVVLSCLLNQCERAPLRGFNVPRLTQWKLEDFQIPLEAMLNRLSQHLAASEFREELDAVRSLIAGQRHYCNLKEVSEYPLDADDWINVFRNDILPVLVEARSLFAARARFAALGTPLDNTQVLLRRMNAKFIDFVWDENRGYASWAGASDRDARPMLTTDVLREVLLPELDESDMVYFIVFDGMSLLSWERIRSRLLARLFNIERDDAAMAIVPTATHYARTAIFRGQFPVGYMSPSRPTSLNERVLLENALAELGAGVGIAERCFMKYEQRSDREEDKEKREELLALLNARAKLKVIIFDPHDKVTHLAQGHAEDFAELFYRKTIHPVMEVIGQLPKTSVVITSDHGFCEIAEQRAVRGIIGKGSVRQSDYLYDARSTARRGHFGKRYIDLGDRDFRQRQSEAWVRAIPDPAKWGLPATNGFVIAVGDCGFSLDEKKEKMFAHGGVSLEEMIVPVAVLRTKPRH